MGNFDRVIWIVLDGVGAGALPDAAAYGDPGSDTLGNLSRAIQKVRGGPLFLPHLEKWGIGNITPMEGVPPCQSGFGIGAFGRAEERSAGKDTTSGHWEMTGLAIQQGFSTYPQGFPQTILDRWIKENNLPGILGNKTASGTEIIEELGAEHMRTGKPIVYTSADSVWQIAAHEQSFGLERLYSISKSARKICDELQIGRVIARPFIGDPSKGEKFQRTYNRKDLSQLPPQATMLQYLVDQGVPTLGIGKISAIFAGQGIQNNLDTQGNTDGLRVLVEQMKSFERGLIFCNLIDFDMLYGHRRDVPGFAGALEEFDQFVPAILKHTRENDLILICADHGNDPTYRGTDHTREYSPILAYSKKQKGFGPRHLGTRTSYADIGATMYEALTGEAPPAGLTGRSFLEEMGCA